jgi:hypothetical protein
MSDLLKLIIAGGGALLLGLLMGWGIGGAGKGELEEAVAQATRQKAAAAAALKEERSACERKEKKARRTRYLLLTKEHLLRALVELYASNYGLASQQMADARARLRKASKYFEAGQRKRVTKIFEQLGSTQTLVMRLDPMARKLVQDLLAELQALPGAR